MGFDPGFERLTCLATLKSSDRTKQSVCRWLYIYMSAVEVFSMYHSSLILTILEYFIPWWSWKHETISCNTWFQILCYTACMHTMLNIKHSHSRYCNPVNIVILYNTGVHGVMGIVIGNGHDNTSSNHGQSWLYFT